MKTTPILKQFLNEEIVPPLKGALFQDVFMRIPNWNLEVSITYLLKWTVGNHQNETEVLETRGRTPTLGHFANLHLLCWKDYCTHQWHITYQAGSRRFILVDDASGQKETNSHFYGLSEVSRLLMNTWGWKDRSGRSLAPNNSPTFLLPSEDAQLRNISGVSASHLLLSAKMGAWRRNRRTTVNKARMKIINSFSANEKKCWKFI